MRPFIGGHNVIVLQITLLLVGFLIFTSSVDTSHSTINNSFSDELPVEARTFYINHHPEAFKAAKSEVMALIESGEIDTSSSANQHLPEKLKSKYVLLHADSYNSDEIREIAQSIDESGDRLTGLRFQLAEILSTVHHEETEEYPSQNDKLPDLIASFQNHPDCYTAELALINFLSAQFYSSSGDHTQALEFYNNLLQIEDIEDKAPRLRLLAKRYMSHDYVSINQSNDGYDAVSKVPHQNEALPEHLQLDPVRTGYYLSWASFNVGYIHNRDELLEQTIEQIDDLLAEYNATDYITEFNLFAIKAYAHQELQLLEEAYSYLRKAMQAEEEAGMYPGELQADRYKSKAFNHSTRVGHLGADWEDVYPQAIDYILKSIEALTIDFTPESILDFPDPDQIEASPISFEVIGSAGNLLGGKSRKTGKIDHIKGSLHAYQLAIDLMDEMRIQKSAKDHELRLDSRRRGTYKNAAVKSYLLYRETGDPSYKDDVLSYFEESRIWRLERIMQKNEALESVEIAESIRHQKEQLQSGITRLDRDYRTKRKDPDISSSQYSPLQIELMQKRSELDQVIETIEEENPEFHQMRFPENEIHYNDIQEVLYEDEAMLGYFVQHNDIIAVLITRDEFTVHRHFDNELDIGAKAERIHRLASSRALIRSNPRDEFIQKSHKLYEILVAPFEDHLENIEKLTILPDNEFYYLPFEALLTSGSDTSELSELDYLIRDFAISYQYGLNLFYQDRTRESSQGIEKLVSMAPVFDQEPTAGLGSYLYSDYVSRNITQTIHSLPHSKAEVEYISDLYDQNGFTYSTFLNQDAHLDLLHDPPQTDIFHIATHGIYNARDPELSSLILFQPGTTLPDHLYATEISQLDLDVDLLVLSSCDTGYGPLDYGEGIQSLNRAFYQAGARNLIYSMWQVSDASTSALMKSFYTHLLEGYSYSRALQQAKLGLLEDETTAAPFYWSPFMYTGI